MVYDHNTHFFVVTCMSIMLSWHNRNLPKYFYRSSLTTILSIYFKLWNISALGSLLKMLKIKTFLVQHKIYNDISFIWIVLNVRVYSHVTLFNMDFSVILYTGTLTYMGCICLNIHLIMSTIYSRCKTTLLYLTLKQSLDMHLALMGYVIIKNC